MHFIYRINETTVYLEEGRSVRLELERELLWQAYVLVGHVRAIIQVAEAFNRVGRFRVDIGAERTVDWRCEVLCTGDQDFLVAVVQSYEFCVHAIEYDVVVYCI